MRKVFFGRAGRKALRSLQPKATKRVIDKVDGFAMGKTVDIKRLKGEENAYRIRVGDLRIICQVGDEKIIVLDVMPRGSAYKK